MHVARRNTILVEDAGVSSLIDMELLEPKDVSESNHGIKQVKLNDKAQRIQQVLVDRGYLFVNLLGAN